MGSYAKWLNVWAWCDIRDLENGVTYVKKQWQGERERKFMKTFFFYDLETSGLNARELGNVQIWN